MKNTEKVYFFKKKSVYLEMMPHPSALSDIEARTMLLKTTVMQVVMAIASLPFSSGTKRRNDTTFSQRCSNKFNDPLILTEIFCLGLFCVERSAWV